MRPGFDRDDVVTALDSIVVRNRNHDGEATDPASAPILVSETSSDARWRLPTELPIDHVNGGSITSARRSIFRRSSSPSTGCTRWCGSHRLREWDRDPNAITRRIAVVTTAGAAATRDA
jgi:hypothetical protein